MKSDYIFKAIGDAEDQFLERTENASKIKRIPLPWAKWGAAAACACFVVIGAFAIKSFTPSGSEIEVPGASDGIVSSFPSSVSGIYDSPGNGEVLLFTEVQEALHANAGKDSLYFVSIGIYSDKQILEPDSVEVKKELERLTGLGYKVGYATQWTYQGESDQMDITYTAGYFTADQLDHFAANNHYGYAFSFATNGDGTSVNPEQGLDAEPKL